MAIFFWLPCGQTLCCCKHSIPPQLQTLSFLLNETTVTERTCFEARATAAFSAAAFSATAFAAAAFSGVHCGESEQHITKYEIPHHHHPLPTTSKQNRKAESEMERQNGKAEETYNCKQRPHHHHHRRRWRPIAASCLHQKVLHLVFAIVFRTLGRGFAILEPREDKK